jgi:hypothetical protein
MNRPLIHSLFASAFALGLTACGGGGDSTTAPATTPAPTPVAATPTPAPTPSASPAPSPSPAPSAAPSTDTTITGSAVKGPVSGATVTAKKPDGSNCGTTTTNGSGTYSLTTACRGDLIIEITSGSYTDEATGANKALDTPLKVMITAGGGTVTGVATPLTTMAFSSAFGGVPTTTAAFNTQAQKVAAQFGLSNVNLVTTQPSVTGAVNNYGEVLKAFSQYLKENSGKTLATITNADFAKSQADFTQFNTLMNQALKNSGSSMTVTYSTTGIVVGSSGAGGGSGTCGVRVTGTVSAAGFNVPLDINYCVEGILGGSCDTGNTSLSQVLSGQGGVAGAANLSYTYSAQCAAGAFKITLQ